MPHFGEALVPIITALLIIVALVTLEAPPMRLHIEGFDN